MIHLTFPGTVVRPTAMSAIQHFTTRRFPIRKAAVGIMTETNLCDGLDLFVSLIQAFAWNPLPEEADQCVLICPKHLSNLTPVTQDSK